MATHLFLSDESKQTLREAVETVEGRSAAEVVISIQPWSDRYRDADYLTGVLVALVLLTVMMFVDYTFSFTSIVINTALGFAISAGLSALFFPLRRLWVREKRVSEAIVHGAQATFTRLGVANTRDRSGILVYVSLLEQRCHVIADAGVTSTVGKAEWAAEARKIEAVLSTEGATKAGVQRLATAIKALAPVLEAALPRREDDINELPDIAEEVA